MVSIKKLIYNNLSIHITYFIKISFIIDIILFLCLLDKLWKNFSKNFYSVCN